MLDDDPRPEDLRTALVATGETNTIGAERRAHAVHTLLAHASSSDSPPTTWYKPESDTSALDALCDRGMALAQATPDGANVYALVASAVQPRALQRYDHAKVAVIPDTSPFDGISNIEINAQFLLRGWSVSLSKTCYIAKDDPRELTPRFVHGSITLRLVLDHFGEMINKPPNIARVHFCISSHLWLDKNGLVQSVVASLSVGFSISLFVGCVCCYL